jgi:hypothetical protein
MRRLYLLIALAAACSGVTEPNLGGMPVHHVRLIGELVLTFHADRPADSVRVTVHIRNAGADSARMEFGACSFAVRGVGASGRIWNNALPPNSACPDVGHLMYLGPGETRTRVVYSREVAALAQGMPTSYNVSVFIRVGNQLQQYAAGRVSF